MDIAKITVESRGFFASTYEIAGEIFECDPVYADEKTKKKIASWIYKTYLSDSDEIFDEELLKYLRECENAELIRFCFECKNDEDQRQRTKLSFLKEAVKDFDGDVKKAFLQIADDRLPCPKAKEKKLILAIEQSEAFSKNLVLHTDKTYCFEGFEQSDLSDIRITKEKDHYSLECNAESYETEKSSVMKLNFTQAEVETEIFPVDQSFFPDDPWTLLGNMAHGILSKKELGDTAFNCREKELIPLLCELEAFCIIPSFEEKTEYNFALLKEYLKKHRAEKAQRLLEKITPCCFDKMKSHFGFSKLKAELCTKKACNESLWRELFELVKESQEGYISKKALVSEEKLSAYRSTIENKLHALGFEGTYPLFTRLAPMKGWNLERSYDTSYFVGGEKRCKSFIYCVESSCFDSFDIQFNCGIAFLKKNEEAEDIYSCMFNAKGRRIFKSLIVSSEEEFEALEEMTSVAAKKAQCLPLSKAQKELCYGKISIDWKDFILSSVILGGLFSILMLAAIFIICCSVTSVILGFEAIAEMISIMPWGLMWAIAFFGFGISMTIAELLSGRK